MSYVKNLRKGPLSPEEDNCLRAYVTLVGERRWDAITKATGLNRSGKSCRLRRLSGEEEQLIARWHKKWGNKENRQRDQEILASLHAKKTAQIVANQTKGLEDTSDKNNDVKEELVSSELDDVFLRSPYEYHFSNWITLLPITAENKWIREL
ncbi:hypothetical protein V2J09_006606 [Rumex salicifolius]